MAAGNKGQDMTFPLHELAALGTAACWAASAILAADAVARLGAFRVNLIRQGFVAVLLACVVTATGGWHEIGPAAALTLALSGVCGILLGDTLNFAAVGRIGPRRAGAVYALNAPMAAIMGWAVLDEAPGWQAALGIGLAAAGVAVAILGRTRTDAHHLETVRGTLVAGVAFGLLAAFGQATGSLIARPVMAAGADPWAASLFRVGASGLMAGLIAVTPLAPPVPPGSGPVRRAVLLTLLTALVGLFLGMMLFLYALQGAATGIVATLSATSPVLILPLLWLRTGQRPTAISVLGGALAVTGLALIFTR
jgi:drug/metabolite transporter (DMT)-like permease